MGIFRLLKQWREKSDGTLTGPAVEADSADIRGTTKTEALETDKAHGIADFVIKPDDDYKELLESSVSAGEVVSFSKGAFDADAAAVLDTPGITVNLGQSVFTVADGVDVSPFEIRADNVTLVGGEIDGNKSEQSDTYASGVLIRGDLEGVTVDRVRVHDMKGHGINTGRSGTGEAVTDLMLRNVRSYNNADDGVTLHYTNNATLQGIHTWGNEDDGTMGVSSGIEIEGDCHDITVLGGSAWGHTQGNVGRGLNVEANENGNPYDIAIIGFRARGNNRNYRFLADDSAPNTPEGVELTNCHGTNPQTVNNVEVSGYDITVNGGYYPAEWLRIGGHSRANTVNITGHGRDDGDGAVMVENADCYLTINGWHCSELVFRANPIAARVKDWHATAYPRQITAEDDATVTGLIVKDSDFNNGFGTDGSTAEFVRTVRDGKGEAALSGAAPDATNWPEGAVVEDTDNAGDLYYIYDSSTSSGTSQMAT